MSIIAVKGIPQKWSLIFSVQCLNKVIKGQFEGLNFSAGGRNLKTLYIRLSESIDPMLVIDRITETQFPKGIRLQAIVPKQVPDLPLSNQTMKRGKKVPTKKNQRGKQLQPNHVIQSTHHELLLEIQYKYPGLYNLSRKTRHKLLEEIAKIIFDRIKNIMGANIETRENCFKLSSNYRKNHPHAGDFQLILTTLHELQGMSGAPLLQISEKELLKQPIKHTNNIPFDKTKVACKKYSDKVLRELVTHISALDSQIVDGDTDEMVARKKVREEMKKTLPYMDTVIKQVVTKHFIPSQQLPMHRIRIYGEPFLPSKDAMSPFVHRYHGAASRVIRHPRMYNLLLFKIPQPKYPQLMAMDGTIINGAKLVIRSDNPTYFASDELRSEMSCALGGERDDLLPFNDDIEDELYVDEDVPKSKVEYE